MLRGFSIEKNKDGYYPGGGPALDENGNTNFRFPLVVSPNTYNKLIKFGIAEHILQKSVKSSEENLRGKGKSPESPESLERE